MYSNRHFVLGLTILSLTAASPAFARSAGDNLARCSNRVEKSCSRAAANQLLAGAEDCKNVQGGGYFSKGLEVTIQSSGDIRVLDYASCAPLQYSIANRNIKTYKVESGTVFFLSDDGRVYMMDRDESIFEIRNSKGDHYKAVTDIKGQPGNTGVDLIMSNGQTVSMSFADVLKRAGQDKVTPAKLGIGVPVGGGAIPVGRTRSGGLAY